MLDEGTQCPVVSGDAEAADSAAADRGGQRPLPKLFTRIHVGQVDLDCRQPAAAMASRTATLVWVYAAGLMTRPSKRPRGVPDPVHEVALVVALADNDLDAEFAGRAAQTLSRFRQGRGAIDPGLAGAQQLQIGSVQHQNAHTPAVLGSGVPLRLSETQCPRRSQTAGSNQLMLCEQRPGTRPLAPGRTQLPKGYYSTLTDRGNGLGELVAPGAAAPVRRLLRNVALARQRSRQESGETSRATGRGDRSEGHAGSKATGEVAPGGAVRYG